MSEVRACTAARQEERAGGREAGVPAWNPRWRDSGFRQLLMNGCNYFRFGGSLKLEQKNNLRNVQGCQKGGGKASVLSPFVLSTFI